MKILKVLIPFIAITSCAEVAQADERTVPERFHGEWNSNPADCGSPDNDSIMVIEAREIGFYEGTGRVRGAFQDSPNDVLIVVTISEEEETSTTAMRFAISPDGNRLTEYSESAEPFVRHRCPR